MRGRTRFSGWHPLIVLIAGAVSLTGARALPLVAPPQKDLAADVEKFVAALAARDQFSGSVLLTHKGQPLVLVVLGNTDSDGTQTIATHVRDLIAASVRH